MLVNHNSISLSLPARDNPTNLKMKFILNYNTNDLVKKIVSEQLDRLAIPFHFNELGHLLVTENITEEIRQKMVDVLMGYGITLSKEGRNSLVDDIKKAIDDLIFSKDIRTVKISVYLSKKLNYSYSYLSNLFSEETYTSIENFIILRKIEHAKKLMLDGSMNLTEIAFELDYSSVAHLSGQFKKTTGLTPTSFLRILEKRKIKTQNEKNVNAY